MSIISKGSKLYSIFKFKCPRCQEGEVFRDRNPYHLKNMFKMYSHCSHCGLRYEIEPAFFYGSMYVSYAYTVAIAVATFIIMNWIYDPGIWAIIVALTSVLIIGSPLIFRLSRITWMNIFIKYAPEKRAERLKQ